MRKLNCFSSLSFIQLNICSADFTHLHCGFHRPHLTGQGLQTKEMAFTPRVMLSIVCHPVMMELFKESHGHDYKVNTTSGLYLVLHRPHLVDSFENYHWKGRKRAGSSDRVQKTNRQYYYICYHSTVPQGRDHPLNLSP